MFHLTYIVFNVCRRGNIVQGRQYQSENYIGGGVPDEILIRVVSEESEEGAFGPFTGSSV